MGIQAVPSPRGLLASKKPDHRSPRSRAFLSASDQGYCLAVSDGTPVGAGVVIGAAGAGRVSVIGAIGVGAVATSAARRWPPLKYIAPPTMPISTSRPSST